MTLWRRIDTSPRRAATRIAALLAVLFYAALIPGHLVSQFIGTEAPAAEHSSSHHDHCNSDEKTLPGQAKKNCPFCAGYAAFQFAAEASVAYIVLPREIFSERLTHADNVGLRRVVFRPPSRGPPTLPA
jgi:hypothetical protein